MLDPLLDVPDDPRVLTKCLCLILCELIPCFRYDVLDPLHDVPDDPRVLHVLPRAVQRRPAAEPYTHFWLHVSHFLLDELGGVSVTKRLRLSA